MFLLLRLLVNTVFWLLGQVLIRWQANNTEIRPSQYVKGRSVLAFKAKWMWPWGNEEDGIDGLDGNPPAGWRAWCGKHPVRENIIKWSAWRNPQNNLRYVPVLSPSFDPKHIKSRTWGDGNFFVRQGVYTSFLQHFGPFRFWIGWKFKPGDENGIPANDTRLPRADFVLQFKRKD